MVPFSKVSVVIQAIFYQCHWAWMDHFLALMMPAEYCRRCRENNVLKSLYKQYRDTQTQTNGQKMGHLWKWQLWSKQFFTPGWKLGLSCNPGWRKKLQVCSMGPFLANVSNSKLPLRFGTPGILKRSATDQLIDEYPTLERQYIHSVLIIYCLRRLKQQHTLLNSGTFLHIFLFSSD